jgi:hypothetical protein
MVLSQSEGRNTECRQIESKADSQQAASSASESYV